MNKIRVLLAQVSPIENRALPDLTKKSSDPAVLFGNLLAGIIGVMLVIATLLTLLQLFQGGLEWITSGGDKTGLENARNRILNALIGLLIIFVAWAVYIMILQFLGVIGSGGGIQMKIPTLL